MDHQESRRQLLKNKSSFSNRFQRNAQNKQVRFGPQVRALFDVLGDTMEEILDEEHGVIHHVGNGDDTEDECADIVNLLDDLEDADTAGDEYHDSQEDDQE